MMSPLVESGMNVVQCLGVPNSFDAIVGADAVVSRLGVAALRIGPRISTVVPWTESIDERRLAFAIKSGNFGAPDFFHKAFEMLA